MVLGELGRFPIEVKVKLRMISFWSRLIQSESKLSSFLYKLMLSLYEQNQQTFKWIKCVESIFNEVAKFTFSVFPWNIITTSCFD
jgi:hypothetical protein